MLKAGTFPERMKIIGGKRSAEETKANKKDKVQAAHVYCT